MWPVAREDLREIRDFYEGRQAGLGRVFLAALVNTLDLVVDRPMSFPNVHADLRRARLSKFPHGVFFRTSDDTIDVIAIMHLHRDPRTWHRRI
jgi:plasmid stabilization system protein ParE